MWMFIEYEAIKRYTSKKHIFIELYSLGASTAAWFTNMAYDGFFLVIQKHRLNLEQDTRKFMLFQGNDSFNGSLKRLVWISLNPSLNYRILLLISFVEIIDFSYKIKPVLCMYQYRLLVHIWKH